MLEIVFSEGAAGALAAAIGKKRDAKGEAAAFAGAKLRWRAKGSRLWQRAGRIFAVYRSIWALER